MQRKPRTRKTLAADLRRLGLAPGMVVLVHSSLSSLGWVCGGPVAVVEALLDVLGTDGTLVVPTHSTENSEPAAWRNPPVPESWWSTIRAEMPAFDPLLTPSTAVGVIPETVRRWPGAVRSNHPSTSFAAIGADAVRITDGHALDSGLGENSPLARIYDLDGYVLLLGAGHDSDTSMHLAEYRVPNPPMTRNGAAVDTEGGRAWVSWSDVQFNTDDFDDIGRKFNASRNPATGKVGSAKCMLARQREIVDFAVHQMTKTRR